MVRDIVVNLGLGARDPAGVYAISVAEAFEAHVFGAAVSYEPVIPGNTLGGMPPELFEVQYSRIGKQGARGYRPSSSKQPNAKDFRTKPAF